MPPSGDQSSHEREDSERRRRVVPPSGPSPSAQNNNHSSPLTSEIEDERQVEVPQGERELHRELEWKEALQGRQPGDRYVRVVRPHSREFRRRAPGHLVATERVLEPKGTVSRGLGSFRRILIGRRLPTAMEIQERVGVGKGLALFASDNISSSAYATEEIMRALALAGMGVLSLTLPITLVIIVVLVTVVASYQQIIRAYPNGGGSYVVATENLGPIPGLIAAAALLFDYILTVSVSVAAGVAALTSIFPAMFEQRVLIGVAFVAVLCIGNLRGIRESGTLFAAPTFFYLLAILGLLGYGLFRFATGTMPTYEEPAAWRAMEGIEPLGLLLLLRAFASGSVALSGVEAVSNGVPAFKPPETHNAQKVLILMGTSFGVIFLGMSFLVGQLGILPDPTEQETVVSQLARTFVGNGTPYHYFVQLSTALILVLAANTAFAGFPRLASILAEDRNLPRQFQFRGERLAFSAGIIVLGIIAVSLIVGFEGSVTNLIPLYTIGVFVAFTLSQIGMVVHWWRLRQQENGWHWRAAFNGVGALATGLVAIVVGVAKFALGAWMVLVLLPLLIGMMWGIRRHYRNFEDVLTLDHPDVPLPTLREPRVIVPVSRLDRAALQALAYARSISHDVTAIHVTDDPESAQPLKRRWGQADSGVHVVVVESPYRALIEPLMAYIDAIEKQEPGRPITIVLSQFVPSHFWEWILHNQTSLQLKLRLFFRRNTIVIDVPYRLADFELSSN